jgi:hypothetical protein
VTRARRHLGVAALLALAALAATGGAAQAAKVTETAAGGVVPDGTGGGGLATSRGVFVQTFKLKGSKVNRKQVLDVDVTVSGSGSAPGAAGDLGFKLIAPSGENTRLNFGEDLQSFTALEFDDQSDLFLCNPHQTIQPSCNYISGATLATPGSGTATGAIGASLNPVFGGLNPKGTWTLKTYDFSPSGGRTTLLGGSILEVKTGRRFEKD